MSFDIRHRAGRRRHARAIDRLAARGASQERCSEITIWIAVPLLLALLQLGALLTGRPSTEYLLVPPMAVIVYLLFKSPSAARSSIRGAVLMPAIGAIAGQLAFWWLGLTPWGVAVAVLAVLLAQRWLGVSMPPALALAVLALLLRARGPSYSLDVLVGCVAIAAAFFAWRHWLWSRLPPALRPPKWASAPSLDLRPASWRLAVGV